MSEAVAVETQESRWTRGKVGTLCLIMSEASFFSIFIVAHLFYTGKSLNGPYPAEVLEWPWLATACLLSSSASVVFAVKFLEKGSVPLFTAFLFITALLGSIFLGFTAVEWYGLIFDQGLTIGTNLFGTTFYSLVGFHAAHVTIGVLIMTLMLVLSLGGHVRAEHSERVDMFSWYWHFVDIVWILVFTVVYAIPLWPLF
ncbi:MAG: heme-copper oxidase subunit III [Myxococcota bacterium]|jgi:cytochrome c oxidase subunit 3/cytochrome o ubiquinol oxidase subunit 3|nr:heme-copper oxidase subunit III [Deltaproteobacteria bacterium]MCP4241837.1 heme-copper oxidase subunit III [bacterium]MDP6074587.1 heme-copper oxidase subunit III [Myxococcota bacterium]MDP6243417.1 heme-copper oxidase subunit III [Myxococcota bacterium]MDP7076070.1 heme-copper oxidase subunit III [Myxococcota bacterium]